MFGATADGIHGDRGRASRPPTRTTTTSSSRPRSICSIVVVAIVRGRLGRLLLGLRDSPLALDTEGATTNVTRVLVFCISAFLAGIFGALYAGFVGSVNGATFPSFNSLTIIAVVVLAVGGAPWYAVSAAAFFSVIPSYIDVENIQSYIQIFFGLAVVFVGLRATKPPQVPVWLRNLLDRLGGRRPPPSHRQLPCSRCRTDADRSSPRSPDPIGCPHRRRRGRRQRPVGDRHRRRSTGERHGEVGTRPRARRHHGAVRRPRRGRLAEPRRAGRADHRAHRPERRGQDDHVQRRVRPRAHEPRARR